jgi:hypothetical protein
MPAGLHWIRLAVASATDAVCRLLGVHAQALAATAVGGGAGGPTAVVQPAGTITKLAVPDGAVKAVVQPYPTFGGRPAESPAAFSVRASERLRHKNRAITLWDYERLILDAFPAVYQARCLNHTRYEPSASGTGRYEELAPGHVTVVTIPDLAVPDTRDPLRPSTRLGLLVEIERFLAARMSCFTTLHVCNPLFEEVQVSMRVRFRPGVDEAFHIELLRREITELLSPWAFRSAARPTFNGRVHSSVVVDFVEERSYVDFVTDVVLRRRDATTGKLGPDQQGLEGSRAISILVSAPPAAHDIGVIATDELSVPERCACAPEVG